MNEAQRIAARGRPVTLLDGSIRKVKFGMRQNAEVEEQFGSLGGLQEAMLPIEEVLRDLDETDEDGIAQALSRTKLLSVIGKAVACGLVARDFSFDDAWDSLDELRFPEYTAALFEALAESNPQAPSKTEVPKTEVPSEEPKVLTNPSSLGTTSITSSQLLADEMMKVS